MAKKINIGVIFGGRSGEHEISLLSARSVIAALDPAKYTVTQIGITHEGRWVTGDGALAALLAGEAAALQPAVFLPDPSHANLYAIRDTEHGALLEMLGRLDVLFPALHGTYGEDGAIQGLFEMADVAYVGAGVIGSAVGMDKGVFKDVMAANGIPTVATRVFLRADIERDLEEVIGEAEALAAYPLFTKPANLGSSVGISKCRSRADLIEGLIEAARYDRRVLVERGVDAREIEVSVLGNDHPQASIPGEIIPSREYYSYEAKYLDETSELLIPAPIPAAVSEQVRELAVRAYRAVDCCGLARVDFFLEKQSQAVYLSEINTMPGFTKISMYPKLWEASGLPYAALLDRLIELAFERKAERDRTERKFQ